MFEDGLKTEIRAPVMTSADWSDFAKLVEAVMQVERCLVDEKKNNDANEGPYGKNNSSMQGGERRNEQKRLERKF